MNWHSKRKITPEREARNRRWGFGQEYADGGMGIIGYEVGGEPCPADSQKQSVSQWRIDGLSVYEGDRPVCQCHNEQDARRIVDAMNFLETNSIIISLPLTPEQLAENRKEQAEYKQKRFGDK